jgi:spore coat protein JB
MNNNMYGYNMNNGISDSYIGFIRGNMFDNLYKPYKNHIYKVMSNNEKDAALLKIQELTFTLIDFNLNLDVNDTDTNIIGLYNQYMQELKNLVNDYENKYGPLTLDSNTLNQYPWVWINCPWPWEA